MTRAARLSALGIVRDLPERATDGERRRALIRVVELLDADVQGALLDVLAEALAGEGKHGPLPPHVHRRLAVLTEEVMELIQATNDHAWKAPNAPAVRAETVQVAAVALRMISAHDRFTLTSPQK